MVGATGIELVTPAMSPGGSSGRGIGIGRGGSS
jgi:hypothetical protein